MAEVKKSALTLAKEEVESLKLDKALMEAENVSTAKAINEKFADMESALTTLREQNEELAKKLKTAEQDAQYKTMYANSAAEYKKELDAVHAILDALGVPKKSTAQYSPDLSLTARIFMWREGIKDLPKRED